MVVYLVFACRKVNEAKKLMEIIVTFKLKINCGNYEVIKLSSLGLVVCLSKF